MVDATIREGIGPRQMARLAGLFLFLTTGFGLYAQVGVVGSLIDLRDASITSANIVAHAPFYLAGFSLFMVEMLCQMAMMTCLYLLLRPAGRNVALVALIIGIVGCVIKVMSRVFYLLPLSLFGSPRALMAFDPEQVQALALVTLKINDIGAGVALIFFGVSSLLTAFLMFRSTYLPKVLGVVSMLAGLGWMLYLYRPLADAAFPVIALVGLVAVIGQVLWLTVVGVNEKRWLEIQAQAKAFIWN